MSRLLSRSAARVAPAAVLVVLAVTGCAAASTGDGTPPIDGAAAKVEADWPPTDSLTAVTPESATRDGSYTFDPAMKVGESRSGTVTDRFGTVGHWSVHADWVGSSANPLSFGKDYVIVIDTDMPAGYTFYDETGDSYGLNVAFTSYEHRVFYNSSRPAIRSMSVTFGRH